MKNFDKYSKQYFTPSGVSMDWIHRDAIEKPPVWCSVDLRAGTQALLVPMRLEEKLEFFKLLCDVALRRLRSAFLLPQRPNMNFAARSSSAS